MAALVQTIVSGGIATVYPPQCVACDEMTDQDFALCGSCWRDAHFIGGLVCDQCGTPLPGEEGDGQAVHCDDCLSLPRPWSRGRAVLEYRDTGRRLVLALKHGDRTDLARSAGEWMARAATPLLDGRTVFVPVPLHWSRLMMRRYNQAAMLAKVAARVTGRPVLPDALQRPRPTPSLDGASRDSRFAALADAIRPHPRRGAALKGRRVVLVDDVMTSGATFAASAQAARAAGATDVAVLALARAVKDA